MVELAEIAHDRESAVAGEAARDTIHDDEHTPLNYYSGSRACEVVRDWALDLADSYGLDARDKFIVDHYLELTHRR